METINYLFQPQETVDLTKIQISGVSLYSITPWREANFISRTILNFFSETKEKPILKTKYDRLPIITDATSHVGGNTISFHLSGFKCVNAVEIEEDVCQMLKNNLQVYHLPTNDIHCGDYISLMNRLEQDVVFIDSPWGGQDYRDNPCLDLFLGSVNVITVCRDLISQKKASLIVLKVPVNYNLQGFVNGLSARTILTHKIYRGTHHSYNVLFCW